ncbi:MAG: hypothetical protein AMJ54_04910 [Deltaproteobacteria bacterium SG8_13]|nr:MAG: hypothetical protein AMJ54_04910 [Deltaproteobacteria bacterium SG8_13]
MPNLKKGKHARDWKVQVDRIAGQVRHNCDVSDAKNAGLYSICGLALRLRDLFKWEMGLPPWEEKDSPEILDWIGGREQRWEKLADDHFSRISIQGQDFDPFNTAAINALLEPAGLYYGAGYAHGLKPTFFLAHLERKELVDGIAVVIVGKELARDLLTIPALSQDHCVILRQDSARLHLWDKMFYLKKSARPALQFALECSGLQAKTGDGLRPGLEAVCEAHRDNYIYHEIGEIRDAVFEREEWREMIALYSHSPVELLVRSIKDLLADTNEHGTLQHIIAERNAAAFGLYAAFIDGLAKEIFSEVAPAFQELAASGDWQAVRSAMEAGYTRARRISEQIINLHREGKQKNEPQWARCAIEQQVLGSIIKRS